MEFYKNFNNFLFEQSGTITAPSLRIRNTPEIKDNNIVGGYKKGDNVEILDQKGNWYKTNKGWVSSKYVTVDKSINKATSKNTILSKLDKINFQKYLISKKHNIGKADGIWGPKTKAGILTEISQNPNFVVDVKNYFKQYVNEESGTKVLTELAASHTKIREKIEKNKEKLDDSWWTNVSTSVKTLWDNTFNDTEKKPTDTKKQANDDTGGFLNAFKKIVNASWLPIHLRALVYFILGKTSPMTENNMNKEELDILYAKLNNEMKNEKTFRMSYPWFKKIAGSEILPTAITQSGITKELNAAKNKTEEQKASMLAPSVVGQWMYLLGAAVANKKENGSIEIIDKYDYNEGLETGFFDLLKDNAKNIAALFKGDSHLYSVIRKLTALRHATGYKGFPVKIKMQSQNGNNNVA